MGTGRNWLRGTRAVLIGAALLLLVPVAGAAASTQTFTGTVDASGTALGVHAFTVSSPATVTVDLTWPNSGANLTLFLKTPSGTTVASNTSAEKPKRITYQATTTGTWKINVKAASGASSYTATLTLGPPAPPVNQPRYIRTIGNGKGHATMYPSGLDVDPSGNVYIADTGNDQVAAYSPTGTQLWRVGTRGPKAPGVFQNPRDLAYLGGKLYVADTEQNRVQVLNANNGSVSSVWTYRFGSLIGISAGVDSHGTAVILTCQDDRNTVSEFTPGGTLIREYVAPLGNGNGQLDAPRDAATDSAGNIYVADYANDRMAKFSPTFQWIKNWGSKGSANGQFGRPYGVAVDASNRVYVADSNNERIQEFDQNGGHIANFGSAGTGNGQFSQLRRVAVGTGSSPDVYGADLWGYHVTRFAHSGTFERTYGGTGPATGGFNEPSGITVNGSSLFVADSVNQRIQKFATTTGGFLQSIGHRGWESTDLDGFNWPRDVTMNTATNTLWVADTKNNRLLQFTAAGVPTGKKGGSAGTGADQLHWPFAIASAGADLIVADTFNNRVQRWNTATMTTTWTTPAGLLSSPKDVTVVGNTVYVADSSHNRVVELNATTGAVIDSFGSLHTPQGLAVDSAGRIWVADTAWNRLVEYSPAGVFLQSFGSLGSSNAAFNTPTRIEIAGTTLYVADTFNDRVQVFSIS